MLIQEIAFLISLREVFHTIYVVVDDGVVIVVQVFRSLINNDCISYFRYVIQQLLFSIDAVMFVSKPL